MASDQTPGLIVTETAIGRFLASRKGRWLAIFALFAAATAVTAWSQTALVSFMHTSPCVAQPCVVVFQHRAPFAQPIASLFSFGSFATALLLARRLDLAGDLAWESLWVLKLSMRFNSKVDLSKVQGLIDGVTRWITNVLILVTAISLAFIIVLAYTTL